MWILSYWLKIGSYFGIENALPQIQWVYFLQGSLSLIGVYAAYLLFKKSENKLTPILSMYLVSMHGLMPFISTRSFMESFVIGPVTLGLVLLYQANQENEKNNSKVCWGYFLLGVSSLIRFQIGIMYVAWVGLMLFTKKRKQFIYGVSFGLILILSEALIDIGFGRYAFQTLHDYFAFNSDQEKSGIMPWYNTVLTLAAMIYFPFSALIGKNWISNIKKHWPLIFPIFIYFIIHTINPHKEERYLYPIVGIVLIIWGATWSEGWQSKATKWIWTPIFILLNTTILFAGCFINTQVSLIGPLAELQLKSNKVLVLDLDQINMRPQMASFFIRSPGIYKVIDHQLNLTEEFDQHPELDTVALLSVNPVNTEYFKNMHQTLGQKLKCSEILQATSLSDRILYQLRPERNERRQPTAYFYCQR